MINADQERGDAASDVSVSVSDIYTSPRKKRKIGG